MAPRHSRRLRYSFARRAVPIGAITGINPYLKTSSISVSIPSPAPSLCQYCCRSVINFTNCFPTQQAGILAAKPTAQRRDCSAASLCPFYAARQHHLDNFLVCSSVTRSPLTKRFYTNPFQTFVYADLSVDHYQFHAHYISNILHYKPSLYLPWRAAVFYATLAKTPNIRQCLNQHRCFFCRPFVIFSPPSSS